MTFLVENGPALLFYVFGALAVAGAIGVVSLRNPMYGAISLLTTFLAVAVLFILLHAEFVGIVQIFVYGGGIMVLFLFVIMLVQLHKLPEVKLFGGQTPIVAVLAVVLIVFFGYFLTRMAFDAPNPRPEKLLQSTPGLSGNSQAVAYILYTQQLLPFEIASLFLLVAMIGAVVLGRRN